MPWHFELEKKVHIICKYHSYHSLVINSCKWFAAAAGLFVTPLLSTKNYRRATAAGKN